jgi:DNA-binding MurR/RpiR family transcriptional regulator
MAPLDFEQRVARHYVKMRPAERRVVDYFRANREKVLIDSALTIAERIETSDATVVRATKALGYAGLDALRQALATELRSSLSPAERLSRTLEEVGGTMTAAFEVSLTTHLRCLQSLRDRISPAQFEKIVAGISTARRVVVFGIGPSSAIAGYFVIQLGRFGIDALALSNTGLLFADDLGKVRQGDIVVVLAYGHVYEELECLLERSEQLRLKILLITDTLGVALQQRVDMVLSVPRGQIDMLSMHTATLGFLEAVLVGVATARPAATLSSLNQLNESRRKLAGKATQLQTPK